MHDPDQTVLVSHGTAPEILDAAIRHRDVRSLIDATFDTLQDCYLDESGLFPAAIDKADEPEPTFRDTAIVLLAIERSAKTLMSRTQTREGRRYADYRDRIYRPTLKKLQELAKNPENVLGPETLPADEWAPFREREAFTCALILELMAIESTEETSGRIFIESVSSLLDALTSSYAPHYVFGGASIMGTEPSAFVSFHALRGLMSVVETLRNSAGQHEALAKLTREIISWSTDGSSRERTIFRDPRDFQKHIAVQLERMPKGIGLWLVATELAEVFRKEAAPGSDGSDLARSWSSAFARRIGKATKWLDGFAESAKAECAKKPANPANGAAEAPGSGEKARPGRESMASVQRYRKLSGESWKRAFFQAMVNVLKQVEREYSKVSGKTSLEQLAETLSRGEKIWSAAAAATHEYISKFSKWATVQLHMQLALSTITHKTNFDPAEIPFLLRIYDTWAPEKNPRLIDKGLEVLFKNQQPDGRWPVGAPFWFDRKTQVAIYVANIEIINAAMPLIRERGLEGYRKHLDQIFNWVATNRRPVEVPERNGQPGRILYGWSTDKIFERERLDVWMTARVLRFLVEYEAILQDFISRKTLKDRYDYIEPTEIKGEWDDMLEPALAGGHEEQRFKEKIFDDYIRTFREQGTSSKNALILYGPPGTSKTTIAKAIARELEWKLVTITPSDFVKDGIEKSESMARTLFQDLRRLRNVVVLFDEIDEMLRSRDATEKPEGIAMLRFIVPGMLPKLQDLKQHGETSGLMVVIATNYRDRLDAAVRRKGRVDDEFPTLPADRESRRLQLYEHLLKKLPKKLPKNEESKAARETMEHAAYLANITPGWVYAELKQLANLVNVEHLDSYRLVAPEHGSKDANILYKKKVVSIRALNPSTFYLQRGPDAEGEALKVFEICCPDWKREARARHVQKIIATKRSPPRKKSSPQRGARRRTR